MEGFVGWSLFAAMRMTWLDWRKVLGQCGLHGIVDMVTGDKWADELSAQLNKIRPKACICGILQAGERWISVPLPPPATQDISALRGHWSRGLGLLCRCFGADLWTAWRALHVLLFSDGSVFSGALYDCDLVQS